MVPELIAESRKQHEEQVKTIHDLKLQLQEARQTAQAAEKDKVYFRDQSERWSRTQLFPPLQFKFISHSFITHWNALCKSNFFTCVPSCVHT